MAETHRIAWGAIVADACRERLWREMRTAWSIALLYRWPSVPLTWAAGRLGLTPMAVTLLGLVLALSMPLQAALLPLAAAPVLVAASGFLFHALDCADGSLARLTGRASDRGADVDFLVDMAQWGLLYLAIGILADRTLGTGWAYAALAVAAAWARLLARVVRDRLDDAAVSAPPPLRPAGYPAAFLAGISGLIPFLALAGDWLGVAVAALFVYALLDVAEGLWPLFRRR